MSEYGIGRGETDAGYTGAGYPAHPADMTDRSDVADAPDAADAPEESLRAAEPAAEPPDEPVDEPVEEYTDPQEWIRGLITPWSAPSRASVPGRATY